MYNADAHVILETPTESGVEYTYIFVGADAWPNREGSLGSILLQHYTTFERVKELLSYGAAVHIGPKLEPDYHKTHTYDNPQEGVCVFYDRDRHYQISGYNEDLEEGFGGPKFTQDKNDFSFHDWAYLFRDGKWFVQQYGEEEWHDLQEVYDNYIKQGAEGYYLFGRSYFIRSEEIEKLCVVGRTGFLSHDDKPRGLYVKLKNGYEFTLYFPSDAIFHDGDTYFYSYDEHIHERMESSASRVQYFTFSRCPMFPVSWYDRKNFFGRVESISFNTSTSKTYWLEDIQGVPLGFTWSGVRYNVERM